MRSAYHIADEPAPSPLSKVAVRPLWPMLAVMFGGAWLAWPWFALNAFAIGSASRKRELGLIALGIGLTAALSLVIVRSFERGVIDDEQFGYAIISVVAVKLLCCYRLQLMQTRSYELYRYFGGVSRNGTIAIIIAFMLRKAVLLKLPLVGILFLA